MGARVPGCTETDNPFPFLQQIFLGGFGIDVVSCFHQKNALTVKKLKPKEHSVCRIVPDNDFADLTLPRLQMQRSFRSGLTLAIIRHLEVVLNVSLGVQNPHNVLMVGKFLYYRENPIILSRRGAIRLQVPVPGSFTSELI